MTPRTQRSNPFYSLAAVAALLLSGCGGETAPEGDTTDAAEDTGVRVAVTGALESTLSARGAVFCGPGEGTDPEYMFEVYAMQPPETFNLRLNRDIAPGNYPVVGAGDSGRLRGVDAYFYYRGPDRRSFDSVNEGSITVEAIPTAPGETLIASLTAQLTDDEGAAITLEAQLAVKAGRQSFDDCP